jgi:NitT/TauT family transport system substrate-binding protein
MSKRRTGISRRAVLAGAAAAMAAPARVSAQALDKVVFQTNWRAVSEHGGYYQAVAAGIYKKYGIECEIRQGGPQQNPSQLLLAGRVDMIMSGGFEALNYAKEKLPFLCIASVYQKDPQCILSHPGVGHDDLASLKGKPILIGASSRNTFWPFLKAKFGYTDEQVRPYTFQYQPFLVDKAMSMQGFITSEPYAIGKAGVTPVTHLLANAGYDNYQTTVNVSRKMTEEKRDVVQRFITASIIGWAEYLKGGAVAEEANKVIKELNPDFPQDRIDYSIAMMNDRGLVKSGDALKYGIGAMTAERWKSFYETMRDAGALPAGIDVDAAYSLEFCNRGAGI